MFSELTADTLDGAAVYSMHAGKRNIDVDDIKIAVQTELDHSLTNPPPRDVGTFPDSALMTTVTKNYVALFGPLHLCVSYVAWFSLLPVKQQWDVVVPWLRR